MVIMGMAMVMLWGDHDANKSTNLNMESNHNIGGTSAV